MHLLQTLRSNLGDNAASVDRFLIEDSSRLRVGIEEAKTNQGKLKQLLEKLTATPWQPAVFVEPMMTSQGPRVMVIHGNSRRVVEVAEEVDVNSLTKGDEVLLSHELNVVMARLPSGIPRFGELASFERHTPDGRLVLQLQGDEQIIVDPAGCLLNTTLQPGDLVRWYREYWMAFEKMDRPQGDHLFLEETPTETFVDVGGLGEQINKIKRTILLHLRHAKVAREFRVRRKGSVLLVGCPGCGKTLIVRALANWMAELFPGKHSRFMHIRPGELHSKWFAQSEANYREAFRVAREAGRENPDVPIIMFFDEVDAIGIARGSGMDGTVGRVEERVQTAFMAELDGLESRGNILVVGATNRREALDPALLRPGRLGDLVIEVPRPNLKATREIFGKHLAPEIPYAHTSHGTDNAEARQEIIDSVVSHLFALNGDADLATITFRDGTRRTVRSADLVTGALIANIANSAVERACVRKIETGTAGLEMQDVLAAAADELECAVKVLGPANCHKHLSDLPQDVPVVSVEPVVRRVPRPHRYLNVA
jgi:proteasome-associated ATPase